MPKIPPLYQQYRKTMGNHTNWHDEKQGNQTHQDQRVERLARQPGLHTGSVHRQQVSHAMVQLISILSAVQISSANPATTRNRADRSITRNSMSYGATNSRAPLTLLTVPNSHQDRDVPSVSTQKPRPAVSPAQPTPYVKGQAHQYPQSFSHSVNSDRLSNPSRGQPFSTLKQKRSLSPVENIPYEILTVINDSRFDDRLRNTLDTIFRLAEHAPEVIYAPEQDKNLYLLLKCIQQMQIFIIKNASLRDGRVMLNALINLADTLDSQHEKLLISKFKQHYLSERAFNKALLVSNSSIIDITQGRALPGDLIILSEQDMARIISGKQNTLVNELLEKNNIIVYSFQPLPYEQINRLVQYLSGEKSIEPIDTLAKLLIDPVGTQPAFVSDRRKMAVIAEYLNRVILGMPLYVWCIRQVENIKLDRYSRCTNACLKVQLDDLLASSEDKGVLSLKARAFYQNNVLDKLLPTLTLPMSMQDLEELRSLNINEPRWGFIHAGARLLRDSGAELEGLTLADIEDNGIALHSMLSQKIISPEYYRYFKLPALLSYVEDIYVSDLAAMNSQDMQEVYVRYFEYVKYWEKKNNPVAQLPDLVKGWKTRPALARELLTQYSVSDEYVTRYLNKHSEAKFESKRWERVDLFDGKEFNRFEYQVANGSVTLPNIDTVFDEQNRQLADKVSEVDKLLLPLVFNSLTDAEQKFIEQAKVDRVRIQFNAMHTINKIPLSRHSRLGIEQSGALVYHVPDHIDLLACSLNGIERIYALDISAETHNYRLKRVDRDRQALLCLLDDSAIPSADHEYKLRVTSHYTLKEQGETSQQYIQNLADHRRKALLKRLESKGYDKTTQEKVIDFLLALVPFYTCITEGMKGSLETAVPACTIDIAGMIPLSMWIGKAGLRFGASLLGSTSVALRYGVRQATIRGAMQETNKEIFKHSLFIGKEISPQLARGFGVELLGSIDPTYGLLLLEADDVTDVNDKELEIGAMRNILAVTPNKSRGLERLSAALNEKKAG